MGEGHTAASPARPLQISYTALGTLSSHMLVALQALQGPGNGRLPITATTAHHLPLYVGIPLAQLPVRDDGCQEATDASQHHRIAAHHLMTHQQAPWAQQRLKDVQRGMHGHETCAVGIQALCNASAAAACRTRWAWCTPAVYFSPCDASLLCGTPCLVVNYVPLTPQTIQQCSLSPAWAAWTSRRPAPRGRSAAAPHLGQSRC